MSAMNAGRSRGMRAMYTSVALRLTPAETVAWALARGFGGKKPEDDVVRVGKIE